MERVTAGAERAHGWYYWSSVSAGLGVLVADADPETRPRHEKAPVPGVPAADDAELGNRDHCRSIASPSQHRHAGVAQDDTSGRWPMASTM